MKHGRHIRADIRMPTRPNHSPRTRRGLANLRTALKRIKKGLNKRASPATLRGYIVRCKRQLAEANVKRKQHV